MALSVSEPVPPSPIIRQRNARYPSDAGPDPWWRVSLSKDRNEAGAGPLFRLGFWLIQIEPVKRWFFATRKLWPRIATQLSDRLVSQCRYRNSDKFGFVFAFGELVNSCAMNHLVPHDYGFGNVLPNVVANEVWKGTVILFKKRLSFSHVVEACFAKSLSHWFDEKPRFSAQNLSDRLMVFSSANTEARSASAWWPFLISAVRRTPTSSKPSLTGYTLRSRLF